MPTFEAMEDTASGETPPNSLMRMPGESISNEEDREKVLQKVRQLIGWKHQSFPGAQPVSLTRSDLPLLFRSDYVVCEKTDGVRALLLAASGALYLIGRNEEVHRVDMRLPLRGNAAESQQLTLLDGEIVLDTVEVNGEEVQQPRFMCYDGVYVQRRSLRELNFLERLSIVYTDVILPYEKSQRMAAANPAKQQPPLGIYLKDFFDISHILHIEEFAQRLPHISDGLIFTPVRLPYTPGTCPKLLKWKPPHLNTVDFSVDVLYDQKRCPRLAELFVMVRGTRVFYNEYLAPYGEVYRHIMGMAIDSKVTQLIVECSWITDARVWTFVPKVRTRSDNPSANAVNDGKTDYDFDNGTWVQGGWYAERIRVDKKLPNSLSVVDAVKSSIEDDITFEMLLQEFALFDNNGKIPLYNKCLMPKQYASS
ncbi:mRNA capping enzyme [Babesia caballi]|uniref:mRNA guanylyltransferase n=1 Tax=Babesia caballi TaxID=5871 RepID=A0AAV4LLK0_BABCB|nr:mRNA capping enzyme [Babesia caballi]